jgi:hypothetical protein
MKMKAGGDKTRISQPQQMLFESGRVVALLFQQLNMLRVG